MSALDWILLAAVGVLLVLAMRYCWRHRGPCCGSCEGCSRCGSCRKQ